MSVRGQSNLGFTSPHGNTSVNRRQFIQVTSLLIASAKLGKSQGQSADVGDAREWTDESADPPDAACPWVYSFWMEGNVTKEGISADLAAMR